MNDIDPDFIAEQAAEKWGPDLTRVRWLIENEFPGCGWELYGAEPSTFVAKIRHESEGGEQFSGMAIDPIWALCLAMQAAADGGLHKAVPPPPRPQE